MIEIKYISSLDEIETASKLFWRKYALKRTVMFSLVFLISTVLFVSMVIDGGIGTQRGVVGAVGTGFSLGLFANQWLKPRRVRKKLMEVLQNSPEETYTARFGDETIEIDTVIVDGDNNNEESEQKPETSVYGVNTEELYSQETQALFLLYVNRSLIHVFPKRCIDEQDIDKIREYFTLKKI